MRFWVQFLVPGWGGEDVTSGTRQISTKDIRERDCQPLGTRATEMNEILLDSQIDTVGGPGQGHWSPRTTLNVPALSDLQQWC